MVRVFDDNSRGATRRLREVEHEIELVAGDIRDPGAVDAAMRGIDEVHHLAFVNGTATFYSAPDLVLDVGVKGIVNVIDSCRRHGVGTLILASSSEVYQSPPRVPTDESAPLVIPDPLNPRLSYGAGKIISEMMAINYGRKHFERVLIFRPHNVYGPDMGFDHVIPQFALRLRELAAKGAGGSAAFPIQGSGEETRSFCHVDDLVAGVMIMRERGAHLGIYHIGSTEEVTIAELAQRMASDRRARDRDRAFVAAARQHAAALSRHRRSSPRSDTRRGSSSIRDCPRPSTGIGIARTRRVKLLRRKLLCTVISGSRAPDRRYAPSA